MFRPKNKKEKVNLTKESYKKAKRIFKYLRPYRGMFAIGWIFLVLSSATGVLFPYLLGQLLGGTNTASITPGAQADYSFLSELSLENINSVALLLLVLFLAQSVFSFFRIVLFTKVTENALRDLRNDAFERLIYMPMDFFNKNKVGALTSRLSNDISLIQETLRTTIAEFFRQFIIIVGSILFITIVSWKLALIILASIPVLAIVAVAFGRFIKRLSKDAQNATANSNVVIEESLMGITNVKTFTNETFLLARYAKAVNEIRRLNVKSGNWRGVFVSFIILCLFGAIIFIIWKGLHMTIGPDASLSRGDFFSFVMFSVFMGASIGSLPDLYASIQKAIGATEHLMDLMNEATEKETYTGTTTTPIKGKVTFENVRFSYPQRSDLTVLNGLSFSVDPGKKIALVGSSGAGKSTIASLLQRFYTPSEGRYLIDDISADDYTIEHLRKHMALVPQEVILFSGTIKENIAFGNPEASEEAIIEAAKQANAYEFVSSFPDGFNTEVGDRGIQLSGGQKQRIAIARAILKNPTILILDEATSALDAASERLVQDALDTLMEGRTSFIIAHRLSTVRKADQILVLENGEVVEKGTHDELIKIENGVYAHLSQLQLK